MAGTRSLFRLWGDFEVFEGSLWRSCLIVLIGLWVMSLFLPSITFVFDVNPQIFAGWKILVSGWADLAALQTGWLANVAFWLVALSLISRAPVAWKLYWSAGALLIFSVHTIDLHIRPQFYNVQNIHQGYYVWMAANLGLAILAIVFAAKRAVRKK